MNTSRTSSTAGKALSLLYLLADHPEGMRLSDVSHQLEVSKSSAHMLLATLVEHSFVDRLPSAHYRLGFGAFEVGLAVSEEARFGTLTEPMKELADHCREAVSLAVPRGTEAIIVQRFESSQVLRAEIGIGTRMPLHGSASGKYLLAHMSEAEVDRLYPGATLPESTAHSLRTKAELKKTFPRTLANGYATNESEYVEGVNGIAAGVRDRSGKLLGAVSIAGPSSRFDPLQWKDQIMETAVAMSNRLRSGSPAA